MLVCPLQGRTSMVAQGALAANDDEPPTPGQFSSGFGGFLGTHGRSSTGSTEVAGALARRSLVFEVEAEAHLLPGGGFGVDLKDARLDGVVWLKYIRRKGRLFSLDGT